MPFNGATSALVAKRVIAGTAPLFEVGARQRLQRAVQRAVVLASATGRREHLVERVVQFVVIK
jgi:hypothetical protein